MPGAQAKLRAGGVQDMLELVPSGCVTRAGQPCRERDVLDGLDLPTMDDALRRIVKNGKEQTTTESRKAAAAEHERIIVRYICTHYRLPQGRMLSRDQAAGLVKASKVRLDPGRNKVRECLSAAKAVAKVQPLTQILSADGPDHDCDICPFARFY